MFVLEYLLKALLLLKLFLQKMFYSKISLLMNNVSPIDELPLYDALITF